MIWKAVLYTSLLIAFIAFFLLYERGFSFKNSLIISLFIPVLGSLFIVAGVFLTTLVGTLIVFGSAYYFMNRKKMNHFGTKKIKFNVYRA